MPNRRASSPTKPPKTPARIDGRETPDALATGTPDTRNKTADPVFDLSSLPVVLTLKDMSGIYRVSPMTIRRGIQIGTFAPRPWDKYPYRWRREDVLADLSRQGARAGTARRSPHGFANPRATRRPAKATIPTTPKQRAR